MMIAQVEGVSSMTSSYEQQLLMWLQQVVNERPIGQGDR
jgi:hypothetical protein